MDDLRSYLQATAGEYLRAMIEYTPEAYEIRYLRDDLDEHRARAAMDTIHESIMSSFRDENLEAAVGRRHVTLQVREEAVLINLPREDGGTLVSLEPGAAEKLVGFLDECMQRGHADARVAALNARESTDGL